LSCPTSKEWLVVLKDPASKEKQKRCFSLPSEDKIILSQASHLGPKRLKTGGKKWGDEGGSSKEET